MLASIRALFKKVPTQHGDRTYTNNHGINFIIPTERDKFKHLPFQHIHAPQYVLDFISLDSLPDVFDDGVHLWSCQLKDEKYHHNTVLDEHYGVEEPTRDQIRRRPADFMSYLNFRKWACGHHIEAASDSHGAAIMGDFYVKKALEDYETPFGTFRLSRQIMQGPPANFINVVLTNAGGAFNVISIYYGSPKVWRSPGDWVIMRSSL
jgi:hypothetical protein